MGFCGIGGFSYGFEMTNKFEVVAAADIWDIAINTYKLNHINKNNIEILLQDLTELNPAFWKKYEKKIDVIIAGPPCQGFSMSGKRDTNDKRNSLFEEVIKISEVVKPKYVVIENYDKNDIISQIVSFRNAYAHADDSKLKDYDVIDLCRFTKKMILVHLFVDILKMEEFQIELEKMY